MTVINSEFAKTMSLNGYIGSGKGKQLITVTLIPGLNNISAEEMEMLRKNEEFELHVGIQKMSVIEHEDKDEPTEPETITDIDVTSMSIAKAGGVIGSAVTLELLDEFEQQENGSDEPRKGIFGLLTEQRKAVQDVLDKQAVSKKKGD